MSSIANLPKTYTAAVQKEAGKPFEFVDVEMKEPGAGKVLVKVLACGVCHSDSIVKNEIMPVLPRIPGHEIIGVVQATGDGVKGFKVGDRVGSGWHGGHDGSCDQCRAGDFVTCANEGINGILTDGGYAEYCTLDATALAHIPEDADPAKMAPLLCAGVTVFNGMRNMNIKPGSTVAVSGIGGLGHLAIQYAAKSGYNVVALSQSDSKKDLAMKLGAHHYLSGKDVTDQLQKKFGGAALIICTAPNPEVITSLIGGLAVNGILLMLAVPEGPLKIENSIAMIQKRLSIRGWPSGTAKDSEDAVAFALDQGVDCQIETFSLKDADKAYERMISGNVRFRGVLVPEHKS
ncbi:hypothetical protein NliqN6_2067 [Naganishia liquefaciens]|uniref:Enoyl reductase (ER) domain-containing protein n=1 Tax=Naganishia liquefaciens TaxID=104408 RepID=A0A8H3TS73_9TREE|nr:hypothetical protein NliqN6_2067 [Naganishia liquefaciens]